LAARPASNFELITHHFCDDLSTKPKYQKTYRRLFGMIFLRVPRVASDYAATACKSKKHEKVEKTESKVAFLFRDPPVFLPKHPKKVEKCCLMIREPLVAKVCACRVERIARELAFRGC